jgi:hypothetical protein
MNRYRFRVPIGSQLGGVACDMAHWQLSPVERAERGPAGGSVRAANEGKSGTQRVRSRPSVPRQDLYPVSVTFFLFWSVSMTKSSCPYLPPTPQCFGQEGVHLRQSFRFLKQHGQAHQGYGWIGQQLGSGFFDLAPSILHYNWF